MATLVASARSARRATLAPLAVWPDEAREIGVDMGDSF
jgi:hypothetical protein